MDIPKNIKLFDYYTKTRIYTCTFIFNIGEVKYTWRKI